MSKIALLIVDLQPAYLQDAQISSASIAKTADYINFIADLLRKGGHPVVHVRDLEDWTEQTSEQFEVIPEIKVEPSDLHVSKYDSNAFWQTDLEDQLRSQDVEFVIVSGFAAEYCVLFTYNGARERGFKATILQDGILSGKSDVIAATYRDRQMISYPAIQFMVGNS